MLRLIILLPEIEIVDGKRERKLPRQSLQKYDNFVKLLGYKNHNCHVTNLFADSKSFPYAKSDIFLQVKRI